MLEFFPTYLKFTLSNLDTGTKNNENVIPRP